MPPVSADSPSLPDLFRTDPAQLRPNQERLVVVDRELILALIKLARFNIHFYQEANRRWFWRSWLYPIEREAGTATSFANTIIDLNERAKGLTNLDRISRLKQKRGLRCAIIGGAISGSASAAELAQNAIVVQMANSEGLSPRDSVDFVRKQVAVIDDLLERRKRIVSATAAGSLHQTYELEGRLLESTRDQSLLEFKRWSVNSREQMWRENTFYAIDSLQNFTSMGSSIVSTKAFSSPWLGGTAAISGLVANTAAALNPPIRSAVGLCIRKYQRWHLLRVLPSPRAGSTDQLLADWADLKKKLPASEAAPINGMHIQEAAFFAENAEKAELVLTREQKQIQRLRQIAAQQSISGPVIGSASVARSLLSTISYYSYRDDPVIGNKLSFAGRISQAAGQTYSLIDTPATRIAETIYTRRLKAKGELPSQQLERRLQRLTELEKEVNQTM